MYSTNVCPSWGMDWSFLCEFLVVVVLYYFCGALDDLVSGQNPTQYTLTWWSCLWCLQRVESSTGMLQNFSAMSVDLCTKVQIARTGSWHRCILAYANCLEPNYSVYAKKWYWNFHAFGNSEFVYCMMEDFIIHFLVVLCSNSLCLAGYQWWVAWIPPGQGGTQLEVCATNLTLFPSLIHKKSVSSKSESKYFWHHVLSLGYVLTVRMTEAFGLPKPSLFCNVQRDVASLPSYSKLNSKYDS